jgi:hypothetical protein
MATQSKPTIPKFRIITGIVISLCSILTCLGAIELAGFLWEKNTAQGPLGWTLVASRRIRLERHGSQSQPYYLFMPNEDYLWRGIPVHINSKGFRTEEYNIQKPINIYRILNIGDSVVFGWEVRQESTYGKLLEALLNKSKNSTHYEVINAGIPGWNLESERNFLLQEGLTYQPDLVILDVTLVNDIYGGGPSVSDNPSLLQWLRDNTYGWSFLTTQIRFLQARKFGPEAIPVLNPPRQAAAYFPLDVDSPVWNEIWGYINEMDQACKAHGIRFIVVAFPTAFQLNSAAHPNIPQQVLGKRSFESGIEFLDLLPIYQQACAEAEPNACEGYINLLFADVWMHPNELGHELAAREILSRITNQIDIQK